MTASQLFSSAVLFFALFMPTTHAKKPPAFKPMDGRVWFANHQSYETKAKVLGAKASASQHFELGQWAFANGLEDEAWQQWLAAIKKDPNHKKSRKAMGYARTKKGWDRPGSVNKKWIAKVDKAGRGFSFAVAIEDDADAAFFEDLSWRFRRMNWFVWHLTEGQVYLKAITLKDKSSDGRFVISKGKLNQTLLQGGGAFAMRAGRKDWQVRSAGKIYVRILVHEFFHGIFGLPDERHGCHCLMQGGLYGIRTDQLAMCDRKTHRASTVTPEPCWDIILRRHPDMVHPNKARTGRAPEVKITIHDR